ncbi:MAG: putative colanic acid biosynthesis acetyltransferase [Puniceicoccaceae bacterium]|nr:putative colanic acid biosynthesis acetyltransferase [Puniceicoccaceae bacterium]|tara:strand:- start:2417 stop:2965 length:549 start_codon:yes stop_codon:yes gene_type:complete
MKKLDIKANRAISKYSKRELLLRVIWIFGKLVFRLTPRPCFGLRRAILRCFGAKVGRNVNIYPSALIYFPWNLEIGDDSSIGEWALIYNLGSITIGELTTISQRAHLCAGTHDYKDAAMPLMKPPINVGDEVWVCADSFVGPKVNIASRAIVAAASVVVKDVACNNIVGGNPAKFIKKRDLG